jgi:hypothetical protein
VRTNTWHSQLGCEDAVIEIEVNDVMSDIDRRRSHDRDAHGDEYHHEHDMTPHL